MEETETTVKIKKSKQGDFTQIDNTIIRDKNVSHKALGYFVRLWYLPDNFEIKKSGLETLFGIKKNQYYTLNKELSANGYLNVAQIKDHKGRFCQNEWELDDMGNLTVSQKTVCRKTAYRFSDTNNTIYNNTLREEEERKKEKRTPTDNEIDFAINECGLSALEAIVKFDDFLLWEESKNSKRSFKKYLVDGLAKGW
jgi:hypothetical protein